MPNKEANTLSDTVEALKAKAKDLKLENKSYKEIAETLGIGRETARRYVLDISRKKMDASRPKSPAELIEHDYTTSKLRNQAVTNQRKYQELLKKFIELEQRNEVLTAIKEKPLAPLVITPKRAPAAKNEAVAIALASDWHVEEQVNPKTINYINEYNPTIARFRANNYFINLLKLVEKERQDVDIDKLVLWLGGDLITGYIHDELIEDNFMSPTEAILFAQELIFTGIKYLVEFGNFKEILIPCSYGNHGRIHVKKKISSGFKNSYEWMLYHTLSQFFESESRVKFQISDGYFNYLELYGKTLRFHHGDFVGYNGGVGGVTVPLNKFIARSNQQIVADMDCIGHFHQLTPNPSFTINGSLIGFNAYAQSIGASPEPAKQAFQILDSVRGFTISAPILVEDGTGKY